MIDIDRLQLKNEFNDQHDWVSILKLAPMVSTSTFPSGLHIPPVWNSVNMCHRCAGQHHDYGIAWLGRYWTDLYIYIYILCCTCNYLTSISCHKASSDMCGSLSMTLGSTSGLGICTDYWANVCRCSTLEQMIAIVVSKSLWFLKRIANPSKPAALGVATCDFMLVM